MFDRFYRRSGMVNLDLSGKMGGAGGGHTKEILLGVGLGAVALVSVVLIISGMTRDPHTPKPRERIRMICTECEHTFEMSELDQPWEKLKDRPALGIRADCPKCNGDLTCVEARICPSCGHIFAPPEDGEALVCPKCDTDIMRYIIDHRGK